MNNYVANIFEDNKANIVLSPILWSGPKSNKTINLLSKQGMARPWVRPTDPVLKGTLKTKELGGQN